MKWTKYLGAMLIAGAITGGLPSQPVWAAPQADVIYIQPLFEYPVAPEEITDLTGKSNWLMDHFWDNFDVKSKSTVDQNALNDAFRVYSLPMRWADRDNVINSTNRLLANASKSPAMMLQMVKAAEENLYGPRSEGRVDEVYLLYLEALVKNKKVPTARKLRYERQLTQLRNTQQGNVPPEFKFTSPTGTSETFRPGLLTVIEFGDPDCDDCRHAKLKMDTDVRFSSMVEKGLINVLFIIPDPEEGWEMKVAGYPKLWHTGASEEVSDIYDIRDTPFFYVIDTDGRIVTKTNDVLTAMSAAMDQVK